MIDKRKIAELTVLLSTLMLGIGLANAAELPDLIISDIAWSPTNPPVGDSVTFTVTIKNQGSGDALSSYVYYYIDGSKVDSDSVSSIQAGDTTTETFSWTAKAGSHPVKADADATNKVSESNEDNNDATETFKASPTPTTTPTQKPTQTPKPTPSPTPQQTCEITVYSDQKDSTIHVDGKYAGTTSKSSSKYPGLYYGDVRGLSPGSHKVKVSKTNYQEETQTAKAVIGEDVRVFFYLKLIDISTPTPSPSAPVPLPTRATPSPTYLNLDTFFDVVAIIAIIFVFLIALKVIYG